MTLSWRVRLFRRALGIGQPSRPLELRPNLIVPMAVLLSLRPDARFSLLVLRPLFAGESGVVLREVAG